MSVCFSLHWTSCLMAVVIWHDFFPPLSPYINSERKLQVFCSYVLNSSARQHAECSFQNCDGQIKITTCLSRQNDHSMMLPAEINSAVDSRGDSEAVSAAPSVQVLNIQRDLSFTCGSQFTPAAFTNENVHQAKYFR